MGQSVPALSLLFPSKRSSHSDSQPSDTPPGPSGVGKVTQGDQKCYFLLLSRSEERRQAAQSLRPPGRSGVRSGRGSETQESK